MAVILFFLAYFFFVFLSRGDGGFRAIHYNIKFIFISINWLYLTPTLLTLQARGDSITAIQYVFMVFLFFLCFMIAVRSNARAIAPRKTLLLGFETALERLTRNRRFIYFIFVLYVLVTLFLGRFMSYEESITYRLETIGIKEYTSNLIKYIFVTPLLPLIVFGSIRNKQIVPLIGTLCLTIFQTLTGARILLVTVVFTIYYGLYRFRNMRLNILTVLIGAAIGASVLVTVGYARSGKTALENVQQFVDITSNLDLQMFDLIGIGEFTLPAGSIVEVLTDERMAFDPILPLKDLSTLVPTNLWPGRPLSPAEERMRILYPEYLATGHGFGFSNVAYGYWWLGYAGIVLYGLLAGYLFKTLHYLIRTYHYLGAFLFVTIFAELFNFTRGTSIVGFLKNSIVLNFVPMILGLFIYNLFLRAIFREKNTLLR